MRCGVVPRGRVRDSVRGEGLDNALSSPWLRGPSCRWLDHSSLRDSKTRFGLGDVRVWGSERSNQ